MLSLTVGIDEVATETQITEGWSFFLLPSEAVSLFTNGWNAIKQKSKLKTFHGKKFRLRDADAYLEFLRLARTQLENQAPSALVCSLMNEKWKGTFVPFAESILKNAFSTVGLNDAKIEKLLTKFVPPLFTFQRLTRNLSPPTSLRIEIDADKIKKDFPNSIVTAKKTRVHVGVPFRGFYNAYRKRRFPNSPELERHGLTVVDDAISSSIQAADVFGNFTLNSLFVKLGAVSKIRSKKMEILEEVFGDVLKGDHGASKCRISGNDLELMHDGTLNSTISNGF